MALTNDENSGAMSNALAFSEPPTAPAPVYNFNPPPITAPQWSNQPVGGSPDLSGGNTVDSNVPPLFNPAPPPPPNYNPTNDPMSRFNQMPMGSPMLPASTLAPAAKPQGMTLSPLAGNLPPGYSNMFNFSDSPMPFGGPLGPNGKIAPFAPPPLVMPNPNGNPPPNGNNQRGPGGGNGGNSSGGYAPPAPYAPPIVPGINTPPNSLMQAANQIKAMPLGNYSSLDIPDEIWQMIPEQMRGKFGSAIMNFLRSRGYNPMGNVGTYGERSFNRAGGAGPIWFDPNLFSAISDPETRNWVQYFLGERGFTNRTPYPTDPQVSSEAKPPQSADVLPAA